MSKMENTKCFDETQPHPDVNFGPFYFWPSPYCTEPKYLALDFPKSFNTKIVIVMKLAT